MPMNEGKNEEENMESHHAMNGISRVKEGTLETYTFGMTMISLVRFPSSF